MGRSAPDLPQYRPLEKIARASTPQASARCFPELQHQQNSKKTHYIDGQRYFAETPTAHSKQRTCARPVYRTYVRTYVVHRGDERTHTGSTANEAHAQREAYSMHTQRETQTHTTSTYNDVHTQHTNNVHKQPLTQYTSTHYTAPQEWAWYSRAVGNATACTHYNTTDNEAHSSTVHTQRDTQQQTTQAHTLLKK